MYPIYRFVAVPFFLLKSGSGGENHSSAWVSWEELSPNLCA